MRRVLSPLLALSGLALLVAGLWAYFASAGPDLAPPPTIPVTEGGEGTGRSANAVGETLVPYTQTDDGEGAVTVEATPLTPGAVRQDPSLAERAQGVDVVRELGIAVGFLTHSVDLAGIDLVAAGTVRTSEGEAQAVRWQTLSDDNHHRSGTLVFPRVDLAGNGTLTLSLAGVAGVPNRTFTWTLPLP